MRPSELSSKPSEGDPRESAPRYFLVELREINGHQRADIVEVAHDEGVYLSGELGTAGAWSVGCTLTAPLAVAMAMQEHLR